MTLDHIAGDLRVVVRSLRRAPGFAAVVTATLAIGIGAVTALFSAVYSYVYRELPYPDAERIVAIQEMGRDAYVFPQALSIESARAVIEGSRSFERMSLFRNGYSKYSIADRPTELSTMWIDSSFAPLFGVRPQVGRALSSDELQSSSNRAVVSDALWQSSFAADPGIVGKTLRVGDTLLTIVGVMPKGFRYPMRTDVWRPLRLSDSSDVPMTLLGKRKPGVSKARVAGELALIARRLAQSDSARLARLSLTPTEMVNRNVGRALGIALLFVGAAGFVLLIACANVANLFLVRSAERRSEMSIRASLGASKARLVMRGLLEALVLSGFASAIGCLLSMLIVKIGLSFVPGQGLPSWVKFDVDGRILAFTSLVCVAVTLAVGVVPALDGSRPDLMRLLKSGGGGALSRGGVSRRARAGIVVQLTFSVVLLVASLLFARTYNRISNIDLGYPASQIARLSFVFTDAQYSSDTAQSLFAKQFLRSAKTLPGMRSSAIEGRSNWTALIGAPPRKPSARRGRERPDSRLFVDGELAKSRLQTGTLPNEFTSVSSDYFRALGLRVLVGRGVDATDVAGEGRIVVVSKRFADLFWPQASPIGHTIRFGESGVSAAIVGVVENVRRISNGKNGISADPQPDAYFSIDQVAPSNPTVLVRSPGDPAALRAPAERLVRALDPMMELDFSTLDRSVTGLQFQSKFFGGLLFAFATSGLILSMIGIYGIVAYGVTERTREIGIRIALGGTTAEVLQMVLRSSLRFIAVGLAVGLLVSQGTNRLLGVLLYDVSPTDPLTYLIVCSSFAGVAFLAAYLPARRVLRVDPMIALRAE